MTYSVPDEVADRLEVASRDGNALYAARQKAQRDGREVMTAITAFAPGAKSPDDVPTDYMPRWLAHLIHVFDNGLAEQNVSEFLHNLALRSRRWRGLSDDAWARIRLLFLHDCVRHALDAAAARQPKPTPAYWEDIDFVGTAVRAALLGEGNWDVAASAAETEMRKWSAEAVGSDPSKGAAPENAFASARAAMQTIDSAVQAARKAFDLGSAYTAERAANTAGAPASDEAKATRWNFLGCLFALFDTELSAVANT